MQDRYVADVGDFGKYGLLRCLTGMTCGPKQDTLQLGVIWYLTPSCLGNANDGKHLSYLYQRPRFEGCDKELFQKLGRLCGEITNRENGRRIRRPEYMRTEENFIVEKPALKRIQNLKILGNASFYDKPLRINTNREEWWDGARMKLKENCGLLFMDPDNGLRVQYGGNGAELLGQSESGQKHISREEICEVLNEWNATSVIVYHHLCRNGGGHDNQIRLIAGALKKIAPKGTTIRALRYRRGSSRAFFVLTMKQNGIIQSRIDCFAGSPWFHNNHFQIVS